MLPITDKCRYKIIDSKCAGDLQEAIRWHFPTHPSETGREGIAKFHRRECHAETEDVVRQPLVGREVEEREAKVHERRRAAPDEDAKHGCLFPIKEKQL